MEEGFAVALPVSEDGAALHPSRLSSGVGRLRRAE